MTINDTNHSNSSPARKIPWVFITVTLSVVLLIALAITMMPKGIQMTHEQIGTGKPALVFVYDPNLAVSISQPEQMNIARGIVGDKVFFLVAKIGTVQGDTLIVEHRARPAELLLFDASGKLTKRQFALKSAEELIAWFDLTAH